MSYLQIYLNDALKEEVKLQAQVTTIGRGTDNDIRIDNAGVSARHARIIREGAAFILEDTDSRNGTFVNGTRITRQPLEHGDKITIFKHVLKFAPLPSQTEAAHSVSRDTHAVEQGGTVAVDVSQLGSLLGQQRAGKGAHLLLSGSANGKNKHPLSKQDIVIGRGAACDLKVRGWFAPRVAAKISQRGEAFYLFPQKRGKVRINGVVTAATSKLNHGDRVEIRDLEFEFRSAAQSR